MKIYGRESANGDFPCAQLENAIMWLWKNPELILINMFSPTFVPNVVTLAWKMSSGMPKEAGSLNSPLCAYLMRQNLHDLTRPRSLGKKCPYQIWKWFVKNYGRESVNGACLPCRPPACPLGRRQYPGALKGCGVKTPSLSARLVQLSFSTTMMSHGAIICKWRN